MPKDEQEHLHVVLPAVLMGSLRQAASNREQTLTVVVKNALREYLAKPPS